MSKTYVAILAGGVGSRFWPASREAKPKQFLDMLGLGKSLLQLTVERFERLVPLEQILIVTNERYTDLVMEQLPAINPDNILSEPSRNNTAPCIAYAAFKLAEKDPDANLIVASSDHIILKEDNLIHALQLAISYIQEHDSLITLGILPHRPDTGYGYIEFEAEASQGLHKVIRFTEKPNVDRAKQMIESGNFLWNAGIFIWSLKSLISALEVHAPQIFQIFDHGKKLLNTEDEKDFLAGHYHLCPNISIDYAIMEKAGNVFTISADLGWSDLGTWASLYAESAKDPDGNALLQGKIDSNGSSNCLIRVPEHKFAIVHGLEDYIIVDESDVLLIYPKNLEQDIKQVASRFPVLQ